MNRQNVMRRLRSLRNWETVNIFFLPACLVFLLKQLQEQHWQPYALSMVIICTILAQGAFYWHLKIQALDRDKRALPAYFYPTFSTFRWINVLLLLIYPALALGNKIIASVNFQISLWSNLVFLFALLEHINYYHYQLSHDNLNDIRYLLKHKKIRRAPLCVDLARNR